jgi:hypothetical protein
LRGAYCADWLPLDQTQLLLRVALKKNVSKRNVDHSEVVGVFVQYDLYIHNAPMKCIIFFAVNG